jgi:hypothetical protein
MPYQPTWNNPYLPQGPQTGALGQSYIQGFQQQQYPQQYQQPVNGITKVNGRDSALQYQLPPNSTSPALFDNNGSMFYVVSTDGTGMKTVEAFDFTPHKEQRPLQIDGAQFVSRQEYDEFVAKVSAALGALNGIHGPVQAQSGPRTADGAAQGNAFGRPDAAGANGGAVGGNMPDA